MMLDDAVLRHEDQPLHARPRHLRVDAGEGRGQELPQRRDEPQRLAAEAVERGGDPRIADAELPAAAVHVLLPDEGGAALVVCRAELAQQFTCDAGVRRRGDAAQPPLRLVRGVQLRGCRSSAAESPTVDAARAAFEMAGIGPERRARSRRSRTPRPATRSCTWPRTGSASTASRKRMIQARRDRDRRAAADQHRRRPHRQRRADRRVRAAPDPRGLPPAARPGRRAPGAGRPAGRLHAGLRRARDRVLHDHARVMHGADFATRMV